jgi:hypothetical protein
MEQLRLRLTIHLRRDATTDMLIAEKRADRWTPERFRLALRDIG